jgi:hypothetical protein
LVIERQFHGIRPNYNELSEEFRLFHNLYSLSLCRPLRGGRWRHSQI